MECVWERAEEVKELVLSHNKAGESEVPQPSACFDREDIMQRNRVVYRTLIADVSILIILQKEVLQINGQSLLKAAVPESRVLSSEGMPTIRLRLSMENQGLWRFHASYGSCIVNILCASPDPI